VADAAKVLADLGANVEQVDPGFADPIEIFQTLWKTGAFNALRSLPEAQRELLDPALRNAVEVGGRISLDQLLDANNARAALGIHMRRFHDRYDLLVTPALAVPAFEAGRNVPADADPGDEWPHWTPFSFPFNLTQQPACSVPCGFTGAGLPVGLQIVGPMYRDDLVLRAAYAYEQANPLWQGGEGQEPVRPSL
jgi:aspartyl-tRNA(Asn)/glutamyl-tRNA(Gln) amidotransferase subunit A